jgi:hypothetical protein
VCSSDLKIWRTHTGVEENHPNGDGFNGYYFLHGIQTNRRYYDDDGDGKIDEDELDGQDNDGDWNPLTDDVGADGIPDSLEVGCTGELYNPITNPDPAHDDYLPSMLDSCHPVSPGIFRLQNDKNLYTENNGIPDHGEPHVDEDYAAMSDQDFYMAATDTFKSYTVPNHFPMGIKVFQKTYAWKDPGAGGFIPMEYQFVNIGHNTIDQVYIGFFADFDIGPVNIASYGAHNYACYIPEVRCGYANNAQDRGSTPAGAVLLGASRPLDSLQLVWQWTGFNNPGTNDSAIYSLMDGEAEPGSLIQPCQSPSAPTDSRIWSSIGPFPTMKPGDTLKLSIALVSGVSVTDMTTNAQLALDLYNNKYFVGVRDDKSPLPSEYRLDQNYPNPFNPSTTIRYDVPKSVWVTLKIYDILGREVATLVNGMESPGYKQVTFNANSLPTGVYTYTLTAGSFVQTKKMMLMK